MFTLDQQIKLRLDLLKVDLNTLSTLSLVYYCDAFGINQVDTDIGKQWVTTNTKKSYLLLALNTHLYGGSTIDLIAQADEIKKYDVHCGNHNADTVLKAMQEYDRLYSLYCDQPDLLTNKLHDVADILDAYVLHHYGHSTAATRATTRSILLNMLKRLMSQSSHFDIIKEYLCRLGRTDHIVKQEAYKTKVIQRTQSLDHLNYFINQARQSLINLNNWRDVAISLGLVTGRQMFSEILRKSTQFSLIPGQNMFIMFTGQSHVYQIPTLVEANLVDAGHYYLAKRGKLSDTYDESQRRVITIRINSSWAIFENIQPISLRYLYAIKAYHNYKNQGGKQKISVYTRSILNTTGLSLNDAYNLNYLIDL